MRYLAFTIPHEVVAASRPRVSRYSVYYSKNYTDFRRDTTSWLKSQNFEKMSGALKLKLIFRMRVPVSWSKKKKASAFGEPMLGKKDLDNMAKGCMDCMQGILFDDDSQIYSISAEKLWTDNSRIEVILEEY